MKDLLFLLCLIGLVTLSCKKVISIDLNNTHTQIVVQGEVTNQPGPYRVSLSQTVNYSNSNTFPPLSGARVILRDNYQLVDTLTEQSPGNYYTHPGWTGQPGNTYTLQINSGGKSYSAISTMPNPVKLDSIGFYNDNSFRKAQIEPIPYFQDPPGGKFYYQFTVTVNDTLLNNIYIFDDQFSSGKYVNQPLFAVDSTLIPIRTGDSLKLGMFCIDQNVYSYFNTLLFNLDPNPFNSVTPANPNSNLSGGALGYFSAHTSEYKTALVHL